MLFISIAPYIFYVFIIHGGSPPDIAGIFLFILGWVYFPMAFASASIAHSIPDAIIKTSPHIVIPLILKDIIEYITAWGIVSLLAIATIFLQKVIAETGSIT